MKDTYTFGRKPAQRNYTIDDLRALKGSGKRLTMCNPGNEVEIKACVDAGIDLLTVWDSQMEVARELAPTHFMGTAMTWSQYATPDEILRAAIRCMEQGADMYYTLRSYDIVEMLAKEGIPVQGHMGLVPTLIVSGQVGCGPTAAPLTKRCRFIAPSNATRMPDVSRLKSNVLPKKRCCI